MALVVTNLPANAGDVRDSGVRSLGREDPLEEGMAIQSSILSCRIPMDRRPWQVTIHRASELDMSEATQHTHFREGRRDQGSQDSFAVMS